MTVQLARRLFTVREYHQMAEAGTFGEDDRLECLEAAPGSALTIWYSPVDVYEEGERFENDHRAGGGLTLRVGVLVRYGVAHSSPDRNPRCTPLPRKGRR